MIRKATAKDLDKINLLGETLHHNFKQLFNIQKEIDNSFAIVLINEDNKEINAFLYALDFSDNIDLLSIVVESEYRNKGIAFNLIKYLMNEYCLTKSITLEVAVNNFNALSLYRRLNFKVVNVRKGYYHGVDALLMRWEMKDIYILAIESSCDETSIAIVKNGTTVEAMTILSQMDTHANYGGVVPEIASRMHTENITLVLDETLKKTNINIVDVDAIAVTYKPGLLGSLLVGIEFAKTLAYVYKKPLIKVNHLIGHIYANAIDNKLEFPLLALVVSGGHTELVVMQDHYNFKLLGATLDDAIGEAYDKVARVLNIPYPGGPGIEKKALEGKDTYKLPRPVLDETYNFSYSGLKSQIINIVHNAKQRNELIREADLACSFQQAAVDELVRKLGLALQNTGIKNVIVAGGVSANKYLRQEIKKVSEEYNAKLNIPDFIYCTDNAAMIGAAAYPIYLKKDFADFSLNAESHANIC